MNALALLMTLAAVVSSTLLIVATRNAGLRGGGPDAYVHDLSEAAFLNGGPARVVDTALTALHTDGRLVVGGPGIVAVQRAEARDAVERAVLQELAAAPSGALHTLRQAVMRHPAVQEIGDGLAARGLLVAPEENRTRRRWAIAQLSVCLVAGPVSLLLTFVQYVLHEGYADVPFPFIVKVLPALVAGALVGALTAASAKARITRAGRRAAEGYAAAHAYVGDPAHLVATRGLGALPDPVLQGQLLAAARYRPARRSSSSSRLSPSPSADSYGSGAALVPVLWCAGSSPGGGGGCGSSSGGGHGSGSSCSSGSSCGGGSSSGSSCGGSSGGSSGSSCSSSSGSSCSSSSS